MRKSTALLAGVLAVVLGGAIAHGDPIPGFSKAQSPLTKVNTSTVGIQASSTGQAGYMSAAQASDLAFVLAGGIVPTPSPFPPLGFPDGISIREVGAASVLAADTFTGANTGNINGRTTTSGSKTWATAVGAGLHALVGITSNKAVSDLANSAAYANAIINTGAVSGTISLTVSNVGTGVSHDGIVFRCTSGFDCLWAGRYNGVCYGIGHTTAGVGNGSTFTFDACTDTLVNGDVLSVTYNGNALSLSKNGVVILSTTNATNNTNTYAGVSTGGGSVTPQWDDFSVTTVAVPVALVIDVPLGGGGVQIPSQAVLSSSLSVAGASALQAITATTLSASGQITSTLANGTAPFVAASSTKVVNWNADLLDGLNSTAFYQSGDSPSFNVLTANTVQVTVQLGVTDHPRGVCGAGREGDINYDAGHFYGCNGATWLQLDN